MSFIEFFNNKYRDQIRSDVNITIRKENSDANSLGRLEGIDLDASEYSGYIYFWSEGYVDYCLYDMINDIEEIPVKIIQTHDYEGMAIIEKMISYFK